MKENFKANIRTLTTELITRKYKEVKKNWQKLERKQKGEKTHFRNENQVTKRNEDIEDRNKKSHLKN